MNQSNELSTVVNSVGLEQSKADSILQSFADCFSQAKILAEESKGIVVTDESQVDLMAQARTARLKLKDIRVNAEKIRVALKEQSLRESRAIDGVSNLIKALIVPVEEHLEKQEKFLEVREQLRLSERLNKRIADLSQYVDDITLYNIKDMSDEAFANLLESSKTAFEAKKDAEAKADKERLEREERQRVFRDRVLKLAPYQDFLDGFVLEETTTEVEFQRWLTIGTTKKAKYQEEQEQLRVQAEKDRKAREDAEAKLREQNLKIQKEKEEQALKVKMEEDAKKKALLAPDKEKLVNLSMVIDMLVLPTVASREAGLVIEEVKKTLTSISNYLREKSQTL